MRTQELISALVPVINRRDTVSKAQRLMNEFHVSQLPLVEDREYLGLLEESAVLDCENPETLVENLPISHLKPAVGAGVHFFEALKLAGDFKLSVIPVVGADGGYLGAITQENLVFTLSHFNGVAEGGGLVVLDMDRHDFMLSEIARLAESEDIHLLSVCTFDDPSTGRLQVLLKTDRRDLNHFIATLENFRYHIKERFHEAGEQDELQRNYDLLMTYLNM